MKGEYIVRFFAKTILREKISESVSAVLPVTGIVLLLLATIVPIPSAMLMAFVIGAFLLIVGMGLFTLGAETAMTPMGKYVGSKITKSRNLFLIIFISLFVGIMITISEPDLQVLANQVPAIPNIALILSVAVGVGIFLVVAMLRIIFAVKLKYLLLVFYTAVFVLAFFVPDSFLAIAFDSGGVTTGPMTVPFIMALGVGVAAIRSDEGNDSFGLVALCSIGPILAVMVLGLLFNAGDAEAAEYMMPEMNDSREIFKAFLIMLPHYMKEVAIAVGPIVVFFLIFRALTGGIGTDGLGTTLMGVAYTYVGLVLFLTGVNVGFMPVGYALGEALAGTSLKYIIVPLGMVIGYFIVSAEPAVQVLTKQVEEVTAGTIPRKVLSLALAIGVSISVGIAMFRVLTGISIMWIVIPGYVIALLLTFFVPDIFTSIAFDSGGVASGPMTATFLLPFAVGACTAVGGNVIEDAFGVVAMVAMTPLIAIQILGLVYKIKLRRSRVAKEADTTTVETVAEEVITDIYSDENDQDDQPTVDDIIDL